MCGRRGLDVYEDVREYHAELLRKERAEREEKMKPIPLDITLFKRGEF